MHSFLDSDCCAAHSHSHFDGVIHSYSSFFPSLLLQHYSLNTLTGGTPEARGERKQGVHNVDMLCSMSERVEGSMPGYTALACSLTSANPSISNRSTVLISFILTCLGIEKKGFSGSAVDAPFGPRRQELFLNPNNRNFFSHLIFFKRMSCRCTSPEAY